MSSEDGPWLDMSAYPDTDPDSVLGGEAQSMLHDALVVDESALSEDVWHQMIATAVGEVDEDPSDPAPGEHTGGDWTLDGDEGSFVGGLEGDGELDFHADHGAHDASFVDSFTTSESDSW